MRWLLGVVILWAGLASPPAAAQDAPSVDLAEEADLQFRLGIDLYRKSDWEGALEHLLASNRLVPNRNVGFNIARCYEQMGQFSQAWRYYAEYVRLEPDPERRSAGERALERVNAQVALVRIETDPPGATVYIDRKNLGPRGTSPVSLALPPGEHSVIVELAGHEEQAVPVNLVVGQTASASAELVQILGTLKVDGTPAGATVRLGDETGEVLGTLPSELSLPPGPHVLVVSAEGFRTARQVVQVSAATPARTAVDLELVTGKLVVDALERDALVEIDGQAAGFTPAVLEVPTGKHVVRVSLRGFRPYEAEVEVSEERSTSLEVQLRTLEEVTAASRTTQSVEEAPASVTLITGQEIRAFGYTSIYDALGGARGVFQSDDLAYKSLGFRGFSRFGDYGNRVLVTLDGHTLNDDQLGASYVSTDSLSDLQDVERIEVVRGPGSALYGTNAFFGVINVVTRDGSDVPRPHASVTADGLGTLRGRVGAGLGDEDLGAWISAVAVTGQGGDYVFPELADLPRSGGIARDADEVDALNLQGKSWFGDLTLQGFYVGHSKAFPTGAFDTIVGDRRATNDDYRSFGELRYEPELSERTRFYGRAYVDHYTYSGDFPYGARYIYSDRWKGTWAGAEPRLVTSPTDWLTVTGGLELVSHFAASLESAENRVLNGNLPPYDSDPDQPGEQLALDEEPTSTVASGYAVAEVAFAPVRLSAGGRYDVFALDYARQFSSFNPRFAAVVAGDRDVVKAIAGTAFRAPSPYEFLYNDGGLSQVPADADTLSPERIGTAELEYTHRFGEVAALTLAAYGNQIESLVDLATNEDDLLQYANSEVPVRTVGAEYEVRRDWRQGWMASFQQSFQRTRVGDLVEGEELDNSPVHLFAFKGAAPIVPGTTWASTRFRAESPRQLREGAGEDPGAPEATGWVYLWDLTVTGEVPVISAEYGLGVRNLLDWQVDQPTGDDLRMTSVPLPGRTLFATLRVEI